MSERCRNLQCVDGKVSVDQGEGLAPCPTCSGPKLHAFGEPHTGPTWEESDARGIYLARVCAGCEDRVLAGYRPSVLSDSNYEADEQIEPDEY